jgi:crossover junction endodeoxyribonuclease RuvC
VLVLGIDPGTRNLGWGVVRSLGNRLQHIDNGVLRVPEELPLSARLLLLDEALAEVLRRFEPVCASVESLFFHKDAQAASKLGHARGVVLLNVERRKIQLAEYAPAQVKLTVTGQGRASKDQVAKMVKLLLNLAVEPPHDAADALALAITHLRRAPLDAKLKRDPLQLATPRRRPRPRAAPGFVIPT